MGIRSKVENDSDMPDWAFVLGLILIIAVLAVGVVAFISTAVSYDPQKSADAEFQYRNRIVQSCLQSEQYTRDECIRLAGNNE